MLQKRINIFNILFPDKHEGFETLFFEDLDSWFSADIACCDNCYEQFVKNWPGTYLHDLDFQKQSIPLDCFYSGSHLCEIFSEEEFWKNLKYIHCPNCGAPLSHNIWPYNFPYKLPPNFDSHLIEIGELSQRTPFLILKHPFALKVYEEIKKIADTIEKKKLPRLFRGRSVAGLTNPKPEDFGPPPASIVKEGRYNHAGKPALYLASSEQTVSFELGLPINKICMSEIEIIEPIKLLCFEYGNIENEILNSLIASSLLSSPQKGEGWNNSQYAFSRFVSDCATDAGFNGIRYPSVRTGEGYNIVLIGDIENLKTIYKIKKIAIPNQHNCI